VNLPPVIETAEGNSMRGEIIKADGTDGPGVILGDDGKRYRFSQVQVRSGVIGAMGSKVDFVDLGEEARDIYILGASPPVGQPVAPPMPQPMAAPAYAQPASGPAPGYAQPGPQAPAYGNAPQPGVGATAYAMPPAQKADGLWTYFTRTLTKNYAQFNGRARRSEYWGYTLFAVLILLVTIAIDAALFFATSSGLEGPEPRIFWWGYLTIAFALFTFIPGLALTVRRFHDMNFSGWLYFGLAVAGAIIPLVPGIAILVITVLDSKPQPNKHGPSPKYGVGQNTANTFS
jgi:uncharacterized membrane protein YhaH (DUF805 family)